MKTRVLQRILYCLVLISLQCTPAVQAQTQTQESEAIAPYASGTTQASALSSAASRNAMIQSPGGIFTPPKKPPGPLRRLMKGAVDEVGGTAAALVGAAIGDSDIELPPDTEQNPSWPFSAPRRTALYTVYWTDGTSAKISKSPEGSYCVTGGGHCMTLQKEQNGMYALLGEDGSMGTLSPRLDGGYTLMKGDGSLLLLLPRPDGGFTVMSNQRTVATIIPGPGRSRHVFSGNL